MKQSFLYKRVWLPILVTFMRGIVVLHLGSKQNLLEAQQVLDQYDHKATA